MKDNNGKPPKYKAKLNTHTQTHMDTSETHVHEAFSRGVSFRKGTLSHNTDQSVCEQAYIFVSYFTTKLDDERARKSVEFRGEMIYVCKLERKTTKSKATVMRNFNRTTIST